MEVRQRDEKNICIGNAEQPSHTKIT